MCVDTGYGKITVARQAFTATVMPLYRHPSYSL